jgi:uncharacterized protein YaiL (DUF2058 family)
MSKKQAAENERTRQLAEQGKRAALERDQRLREQLRMETRTYDRPVRTDH